jgi:hypothetical protein
MSEGSSLNWEMIDNMVERLMMKPKESKPKTLNEQAFFYKIGTYFFFYWLDLYIGYPLAIYYKENLSLKPWEDKPKPYEHPFAKFKVKIK